MNPLESRPDALLVDFAGTLLRPDPPVPEQYLEEASAFLSRNRLPSAPVVNQRFRRAFKRPGLPSGALRYGTTRSQGFIFWKRVVGNVFVSLHDPSLQILSERLFERFARPKAWQVVEGARTVLKALRESDVRTALVSNWDVRGPGLVDRLDLHNLFHTLVFSCRVGVEKPAFAMFERALDELDVDSDSSVVLGNTPESDLVPAVELGLAGVLFEPERSAAWEPRVSTWPQFGRRFFGVTA